MNALAGSSTMTRSAVQRLARPLFGHLPRSSSSSTLGLVHSNGFTSTSRIHSLSTTSPPVRNHRHVALPGLINHMDPLLTGSPSAYLLRRALSPLRYASTYQPSSQTPRPDPDPSEEEDPEPDPNLSAYARLKILFKRYGWYALGMYTVLSALDFTLVFVLIHLAGAERIEPLLQGAAGVWRRARYGKEVADEMAAEAAVQAGLEKKRLAAESGGKKEKSGWMSRTVLAELALAYPIHKVALLPVRAGLTVAWTPKFVGWLTRRGWVGKGGYTRAATHAKDKLQTAKERVKERVQDLKQ